MHRDGSPTAGSPADQRVPDQQIRKEVSAPHVTSAGRSSRIVLFRPRKHVPPIVTKCVCVKRRTASCHAELRSGAEYRDEWQIIVVKQSGCSRPARIA